MVTKPERAPILAYGTSRPRRLRRLLLAAARFLGVILSLAGIAGGAWWWVILRPFQRLEALVQASSKRDVPPAELRAAAHETLTHFCPAPHDAYLVLVEHGDASSVPILIRSLWWQPLTSAHEGMICTKAHCLEALRKLTGLDLGRNYEDWAPLLKNPPTFTPS